MATLRPKRSSHREAASSRDAPLVHSDASLIRHVLKVFSLCRSRPKLVQSNSPGGRLALPGHANVR